MGSFGRPGRGSAGLSETTLSQFWHLTLTPLRPNQHFLSKMLTPLMPNQCFGRIYKDCWYLGWTCQDFKDLDGFGRFWGQNSANSCKNNQNTHIFARDRRFSLEKTAGGRLGLEPPYCLQPRHLLCLQPRHLHCQQPRHLHCQQRRHLHPLTSQW